jgi:predicted transcriptional regulator
MYGAFLSHDQLKEYVVLLMGSGLLECDMATRTYRTTSKGITLLKLIEQMDELVMPTMQNDPA